MTRKLSSTMQKALAEIVLQGGEAHPDGGCYWRSKPMPQGTRLLYKIDGPNGHVNCMVETSTIKALITRGTIESIGEADSIANQSYRVTAKAKELAAIMQEFGKTSPIPRNSGGG